LSKVAQNPTVKIDIFLEFNFYLETEALETKKFKTNFTKN